MENEIQHLDLFSGIGGFAIAVDAVWPNSEHVFVDNDTFCQQVLLKHWPQSQIYGDIKELTIERLLTDSAGERFFRSRAKQKSSQSRVEATADPVYTELKFDILTGGFPCQPFSQAGRRKGTEDDRYLWPAMFKVIQLTKPTWVIAENVRGLVTWNDGLVLQQVCADLESEGYEVQPIVIPAVAVNAPHRRDRIWFIGHSNESRQPGVQDRQRKRENGRSSPKHDKQVDRYPIGVNVQGEREQQECSQSDRLCGGEKHGWNKNWLEVATKLCQLDDELSDWVDRCIGEVIELNDGTPTDTRRTEELQTLSTAIQSPEIWGKIRGLFPMATQRILLQTLCQLSGETYEGGLLSEGKIIPKKAVSKVWQSLEVDCSPQERRNNRQRAEELTNIVSELSYEVALEVMEAWHRLRGAFTSICSQEVKLDGFKLTKAQHRVQQLKAYGNAIVPVVAIEIMKAIKASN